jgi:hypothetical protein
MSRSRRKTPIFGMTGAKSERRDKQTWHSRMRSRVRTVLTAIPLTQLDGYVAPIENEVGSVWEMAKDGKHYFRADRQDAVATRFSSKGKSAIERQSLKIRLLRKWAAK